MNTILELPTEIIGEICTYLDIFTAVKLKKLCRTLNSAIDAMIINNYYNELYITNALSTRVMFRLSISEYQFYIYREVALQDLNGFFSQYKNLTTITIAINNIENREMADNLPNLPLITTNEQELITLFNNLPRAITTLNIDEYYCNKSYLLPDSFIDCLDRLKRLTVLKLPHKNKNLMDIILKRYPKLSVEYDGIVHLSLSKEEMIRCIISKEEMRKILSRLLEKKQ